jgi:hypothetical protein
MKKAHTKVKDLMAKSMPVEKAIFAMVVEQTPSPKDSQA